jgi:hypothetical protein
MPDPAPAAPSAPAPGSLTGVSYAPSAPAPAPAARSGVIDDRAYDALEPAKQAEYARVRRDGEFGGSEWKRRSDLAPDGTPKPAPSSGDPRAATVTPDGKLRIGEGETAFELSADDVKMLMAQKADNDLRATRVPADGVYQPTLPADFKAPEGFEFKVDASDPAYVELTAFARSRSWSQDEFSAVLSVEAARRLREEQAFKAATDREIQKLGVNCTSRVSAVETFLRGQLGDIHASNLRKTLFTAGIVEAYEALLGKFQTQGAASFRQDGRANDPVAPGRVSDEQWAKMSNAEKLNYARQFPQPKTA